MFHSSLQLYFVKMFFYMTDFFVFGSYKTDLFWFMNLFDNFGLICWTLLLMWQKWIVWY